MRAALFLVAALALQGCASSRVSDREATDHFLHGRYAEAATRLDQATREHGDGADQLLYLLDLALSQHAAGDFAASTKTFLIAEKIAEIKDYSNLADESAAFLTSDNVLTYKGEDFENVLINVYLAMNFALERNRESAIVEARKVDRKINLMNSEGKRHYKQNAFARYLTGILYEADREWDNAYLAYKKTYEIEPGFAPLRQDLWRLATLNRMRDEQERWERELGLTREELESARPRPQMAELIVLYQNGISPEKRPNPEFNSLPRFYPRPNPISHAAVEVDGMPAAKTDKLHDIEAAAIQNLEEKYGALIAKKIAGAVAKEAIAHGVERQTDSPLAGFLTRVFFWATNQADLRSWNLLPRDLQIARVWLEPGLRKIKVLAVGAFKDPVEQEIEMRAGEKTFLNVRFAP
jgi:hypothetical protein